MATVWWAMNGIDWPERRQRHKVRLDAEIIRGDGSATATIVSDLSLDGCQIAGWFRIGEPIELKIPRIGRMRGQIRWAMNGRAGVLFRPNVPS